MKKPNFFIVGAPKCGTTSMYSLLRQHPDIYMPDTKEPHYFGSDLTRYGSLYNFNKTEYLELFLDAKSEKMIGEASTHYLYSKLAPSEIRSFNEESKIIIMLRNPVELIYSLHSQFLFSKNENEKDFEKALELEPDRKNGLFIPTNLNLLEKVFYKTYLKRLPGQIRKYIKVFSKENIFIILLEDLKTNPTRTFRDTLTFLNVDNKFKPSFNIKNANKVLRSKILHNFTEIFGPIIGKVRKKMFSESLGFMEKLKKINTIYIKRKPMDPVLYQNLKNEFKPIVKELEIILDRKLLHWNDI